MTRHGVLAESSATIRQSPSTKGRRSISNICPVCIASFLQVTNVFVVQVHIHEGAEFAVVSIEMAAKVGVLSHKPGEGIAHSSSFDFYGRLLASVLAQRRRNMDLGHR